MITSIISIPIILLYLYALVVVAKSLAYGIYYHDLYVLIKNSLFTLLIFIIYTTTIIMTLQNNLIVVVFIFCLTILSITILIISQNKK